MFNYTFTFSTLKKRHGKQSRTNEPTHCGLGSARGPSKTLSVSDVLSEGVEGLSKLPESPSPTRGGGLTLTEVAVDRV